MKGVTKVMMKVVESLIYKKVTKKYSSNKHNCDLSSSLYLSAPSWSKSRTISMSSLFALPLMLHHFALPLMTRFPVQRLTCRRAIRHTFACTAQLKLRRSSHGAHAICLLHFAKSRTATSPPPHKTTS